MNNKILLVEDDQSFGAVLKDYLSINNFDVTLATDGEMGLKEFTENEFDLCLFDVMMPKKDLLLQKMLENLIKQHLSSSSQQKIFGKIYSKVTNLGRTTT